MERASFQLSGEARDALQRISDWSGKTKVEVVRELVLWLDSVDEEVAGPIIGALPKRLRPDFARMVLQQIAYDDDAVGLGDVTPQPSGGESGGSGDESTNGDRQKKQRRQRERPAQRDQ